MTIDGGFVADEPQSFLLTTAAGTRVFCGGDTSLARDLRTWGELYRPGPGGRRPDRLGDQAVPATRVAAQITPFWRSTDGPRWRTARRP
jgi:hypothetical protein